MLEDLEDEKQVRIEVVQLDQLFMKMQDVHDMYLSALDEGSKVEMARQWYDAGDKNVFRSKQRINDYLHEAENLRSGLHDTSSVKSKSSRHSKGSHSSSSSVCLLRLTEAKARAAVLEVEARLLKEKQALRMATEELELRPNIVEAKAEERTYKEFDEEQNIDDMSHYLEDVKAKRTSTPFLSEEKPNNQTTIKVPSVKFQGSTFVSTVATIPPVNTPIFVSTASMNLTVQPFVSRDLTIKERKHRERYETPTDTKPSCNNKEECTFTFERNPSVESARPDQDYFDIQRK